MPTGEGYGDDPASPENVAAAVVRDNEITGVSKVYEPLTDDDEWDHTPHKVTLTRVDEDGLVHEVTFDFRMGRGHDGKAPACADVVEALASDAASIDDAGGDFDVWAAEMGIDVEAESFDDPQMLRRHRRDFEKGIKNSERLAEFLGEEQFERAKYGDDR